MVKLISNTDSLQVRTKVLTEIAKDGKWSISTEQINNFQKILNPEGRWSDVLAPEKIDNLVLLLYNIDI